MTARVFHPFEGEVEIVRDDEETAKSLLVRGEPVGVIVRVLSDGVEVLTGRDQLFETPEEAVTERERVYPASEQPDPAAIARADRGLRHEIEQVSDPRLRHELREML